MYKNFWRFEFKMDLDMWLTPCAGIELDLKEILVALLCFSVTFNFNKRRKK